MWPIALAILSMSQIDSDIKSDEAVLFFPTFARLDKDGTTWVVPIHGWIFEPELNSIRRAASLGLLRRILGLEKEQAETELFKSRARAFLVDNERGKVVSIRLGQKTYALNKSEANGHFEGTLRLPDREAKRLLKAQADKGAWLSFQAVTNADDPRRFAGRVQLVPAAGLSVISDIDDTIKISQVGDRSALMANTFVRTFEHVPGMAELYRGWAAEGARFHYVSASPWQLYEPLSDFRRAAAFPEGTFHLTLFRWKDSTAKSVFASPDDIKRKAIEPILDAFPTRRFIFVGDSGQRDPELYAEFARKRPEQIAGIYIRDAGGDTTPARFDRAFQGLPRSLWNVFRQPAEVKAGH
ncbi:MAG: phosphatidate phosphatase App1 family protein [Pirellulales bacterium]